MRTKCCNCLIPIEIPRRAPRICVDCGITIDVAREKFWTEKHEW